MKVIVVDDERLALDYALALVKGLPAVTCAEGFSDSCQAMEYTQKNAVDIAFLDIEMYGMNGIEMAKKLKDIKPDISIIFITGYSQFAVDAFKVRADGYLLKPVTKEDIQNEINKVLAGVKPKSKRRIKISTFGNFGVYIDEKPVSFKRMKTKELLAYLVDRKGAPVSCGDIIATLWEEKQNDKTTRSMLQNLISDLVATLKENSAENMINKNWNSLSINTETVDCDYYNFLKGDIFAINSYMGEYMQNYSWAEFTLVSLEMKKEKIMERFSVR